MHALVAKTVRLKHQTCRYADCYLAVPMLPDAVGTYILYFVIA